MKNAFNNISGSMKKNYNSIMGAYKRQSPMVRMGIAGAALGAFTAGISRTLNK
jgi:hypothetical protein